MNRIGQESYRMVAFDVSVAGLAVCCFRGFRATKTRQTTNSVAFSPQANYTD
jgi:hypothetical protein